MQYFSAEFDNVSLDVHAVRCEGNLLCSISNDHRFGALHELYVTQRCGMQAFHKYVVSNTAKKFFSKNAKFLKVKGYPFRKKGIIFVFEIGSFTNLKKKLV